MLTTAPSRYRGRDRIGGCHVSQVLRGTDRGVARVRCRTFASRLPTNSRRWSSASKTAPQSCRGSTRRGTRPSACSNAETAWQRPCSTGKFQDGGTWFSSGKRKCLLHFSLPKPCPAPLLSRTRKPTPKRGGIPTFCTFCTLLPPAQFVRQSH